MTWSSSFFVFGAEVRYSATVVHYYSAAVVRQPYRPTANFYGAVGLSHRGSRPNKSPFFIKPIQFPFHWIVLDIIGDAVHFKLITDNMVMVTWLPGK